jgi:TrwC relaxase/AAA domain
MGTGGSEAANGLHRTRLVADKSVSAAWALGGDAERALIQTAHAHAVEFANAYVSSVLGQTRRGKGGTETERGEVGWISVQHFTSRPTAEVARTDEQGEGFTEFAAIPVRSPDPQIHSHVVMLNAVLCRDGHIGSLDLDQLAGRVHEFGAVYQAALAQNLRAQGIATHLDTETGAARVTAIPDSVRQHFSKRSQDVQDAARAFAKEAGQDWDALSNDQQLALLRRGVQSTRLAKEHRNDGSSDFSDWRDQARAIGYQHRSVLRPDERQPELAPEMRHRVAYERSLPLIEEALSHKAKLDAADFRVFAARGLVAAGIGDDPAADIKGVMRLYREHGVRQDGAMTRIVVGRDVPLRGVQRWSVTTEKHEIEEQRVIDLAKQLGDDRSGALPQDGLDQAKADFLASRPHIDPAGQSWCEQSAAIDAAGTGPRLAVIEGVAGAGKTTLLSPIVSTAKAEGRHVHGLARGWKQATALRDSGIEQKDIAATSAFLNRVEKGKLHLDLDSLVILDELSQIGRREMLKLMELQQKQGFRVIAVGDPKQGGSIDPEVIGLLTETLGDKVPRILTSIRQRTERERAIAGLFREGGKGTHQAIGMKRKDGTAIAVAGGRAATIAQVASLWRDRVEARGREADFRLTISAPTNRDAHDIGVAIRQQARDMGQLGADKAVIRVAMRGETGLQPLALAAGDKVRLFNKVIVDRQHFASNGDTVTVLDANNDAMRVRRDDGKEATVKYDQLRARRDMPVQLAYGHALTHDAAQGVTSDEHINAMPDGSRAVNSRKAYPAESRQRDTTWLVTNEAAERRQIANRIPIGTFKPIREPDIWHNVANNLGRADMRQSATDFLRHGTGIRRGSMTALPAASVQAETREQEGRPAPSFQQTQDLHLAERVTWLDWAIERMQQTLEHVREVARERVRAMAWERHTPRHGHEHQAHREAHRPSQGMSFSR